MPFIQYMGLVTMLIVGLVSLGLAKSDSDPAPPSAVLDLLQAEVLDTVLLEQPVYFISPEIKDIVAAPGTYRVVASESAQIRLIAVGRNHTLLVSALNSTHHEQIASPIALYVRDDEKFPHVLLLLPGGAALEAVGSYDVVRSRSLAAVSLTPIQIQAALKQKLEQNGRREP